jgi:transposase
MLQQTYYTEPTEIDRLVFDKLIPEDHYLRQVKARIDFSFVRGLVEDCYSAAFGRPAEDPVRLFKLEFLQLHYSLSDREVLQQAQVNLAFRFFLDLSIESRLPSHGLLSQFRSRLGLDRFQAIFDQIVAQARSHGLIKDGLRLKDATHVIANVAVPSTLVLIAQIRDRLLQSALPYAPERVAEEQAKAEQIRLVTAELKDQERLLHRVEHLRRITDWADGLSQRLGPVEADDSVRARFEQALALAHKLLSDQQGEGDRLRSAVDPDARRGKHGDYFDGYLLDVLLDAESELITAVAILPGNGNEAANAPRLIAAEEAAHGNDVAALSMDGAGWQGPVLRTLEQSLGVTAYVPAPALPEPTGRFGAEDFTLDPTRTVLTCPGGAQTSTRYRNEQDTAWRYEFKHSQCKDCTLLEQCLDRLPANYGRRVYKNDYQAEYDAARARRQSPAYAAVRRVHPRIERKLAELVRYHGGRRARSRGRWRVELEYVLRGIVVNVKRMVRLLMPEQAEVPALAVVPTG